MATSLKTGQSRPLNVTQQANHRVYVGLSWDPNEEQSLAQRLKRVLSRKKRQHDLDLSCYMYDKDGVCLDVVSGKEEGTLMPTSGGIYHSGDDVEGVGSGDDEQISVELIHLPDDVHALVFKASIQSGHKFREILAPALRLVDAYSERRLLAKDITADHVRSDSESHYAFIELYRDGASKSGWSVHFIDAYMSAEDGQDWKSALKSHLSAIKH